MKRRVRLKRGQTLYVGRVAVRVRRVGARRCEFAVDAPHGVVVRRVG